MAYTVPKQITVSKVATSYQSAVAIVPTDATPIGPFAGFIVGSAGTIAVVMRNGDGVGGVAPVTIDVVAGMVYPLAIQGVNFTGTTATGIVGLT